MFNHELLELIKKATSVKKCVENGGVPVFKIEVNYKSGITRRVWCLEFSFERKGDGVLSVDFKHLFNGDRWLFLNLDEVESFYTVDVDVITKEDIEKYDLDI